MPYDPDYMKNLFGDDYEKFVPNKPPDTGHKNPGTGSSGSGKFYSYDVSSGGAGRTGGGDIPEPDARESRNSALGPEDFNVNFDFDREYKDIPENKPIRRRREKRTGCLGGILFSAFIICVSLLLASLAWLAAVDVLGLTGADEQVNVTVPKNYNIGDISDILYDNGLIKYKALFKIYAGFSKAEEKISAGSYTLNKGYDYRALVHGMTARSGVRVETRVSIPEGLTLEQIFTLLENNKVCSADDLWQAAANHEFEYDFLEGTRLGDRRRLEGFLFPNTYNFYVDSTPQQAISKMLNEFKKKFNEELKERADEMGYSVRDIVIIASLIEKEAGNDEERPHIASVIYNRLNNPDFPHLEIDASIHYAIAGTAQTFSTQLDSPYNTYMCEGLPIGPIANPGLESIRAALYPDSTDDYFYALNKANSHNFFKTYEAHKAFVESDEYGG